MCLTYILRERPVSVMVWETVVEFLASSLGSGDVVTFFIVLLAALLFPLLLRGLHIPWVIALIVAGIFLGPSGLELVVEDPVLQFLSQIGIVFLMFMAGLETGFDRLMSLGKESFSIGAANGLIPFAVGVLITLGFGYGFEAAMVVGAVFMSSSVAVVLPTLESRNMLDTEVGTTVISSTMLQDLSSLIFLGAVVHQIDEGAQLPLHLFLFFLFLSIAFLRLAIPRLERFLEYENRHIRGEGFETELRMIIVILIGVVVLYELIGLHPIVSGFLAGLFLSDLIESEEILNKIHAIGYGVFIPVFFVEVGTTFDIAALTNLRAAGALAVTIILGTTVSKYFSGYTVSRLNGFSKAESSIISSTSLPQLSTALAVAYLGVETGILDQNLLASVLMLSIVTTAVSPFLISKTYKWMDIEKEEA